MFWIQLSFDYMFKRLGVLFLFRLDIFFLCVANFMCYIIFFSAVAVSVGMSVAQLLGIVFGAAGLVIVIIGSAFFARR